MSADSIDRRARSTLTDSTWPPLATRPGLRMPGRIDDPERAPVPGHHGIHGSPSSCPASRSTIMRSSRSNRLTSDDLPALGRPTIATETSTGFSGDTVVVPRQPLDHRIEQIADAVAVFGRDLVHGIEPQLIQLEDAALRTLVVGLVDRQQRRLAGFPDHSGDLVIPGDEAFTAIRHEHEQIGVGNSAAPALEHERVQRILAGAKHPTRIDQFEM